MQHRPRPPQPPPRQSRAVLDLAALDTAPACARAWAKMILRKWRLAGLSEDAELIVSELVANGVRASRAMGQAVVRVWLVSDLRQVAVFVWDASPRPPARADPGADAESGRGLMLVEALSERWGHFGYDGGGKVVWAVVAGAGALS